MRTFSSGASAREQAQVVSSILVQMAAQVVGGRDAEAYRVVREENVQSQLEGCKQNKAVYECLAKATSTHGDFERTGPQCREKIKKLRTEYKKRTPMVAPEEE